MQRCQPENRHEVAATSAGTVRDALDVPDLDNPRCSADNYGRIAVISRDFAHGFSCAAFDRPKNTAPLPSGGDVGRYAHVCRPVAVGAGAARTARPGTPRHDVQCAGCSGHCDGCGPACRHDHASVDARAAWQDCHDDGDGGSDHACPLCRHFSFGGSPPSPPSFVCIGRVSVPAAAIVEQAGPQAEAQPFFARGPPQG